jgi:single-stranded DNA-specific DHH superfamily exonuclease
MSRAGKFHLIDLSNIGDWMPLTDFQQLVRQAFGQLHNNGRLVLRRLLGDYSLMDLTVGRITPLYDETGFYSETVVVSK